MLAFTVFALLALGATFAGDRQQFARGSATLTSGARQMTLRVELARTPAERAQGLMNRRSLPANAGMAFLYPEGSRGAFWMKNTLIPLSAAFYDGRGRILRILQMQPCRTESCPLYDPGVTYRGVLEVKAGSFGRWGIRVGDRITVRTAGSPSG